MRRDDPVSCSRFVQFWTVKDGRIVRLDQIANTAAVQAALVAQP